MLRLSGPLKRIPNTKLNKLMCLGDSELKNVAERVCNDYSKLRNVATAEVVKTDSWELDVLHFFQEGVLSVRHECALQKAPQHLFFVQRYPFQCRHVHTVLTSPRST